MKRLLQIAIPLVVVGLALGVALAQLQRTVANRQKMPRPPSYPFEEARRMAQASLPSYLAAIASSYEGSGFRDAEEAKRAVLGTPYISYSFDLWAIADTRHREGDFREKLDGGVAIQFPVLVDGEPRSNIIVEYRDGVWQDGPWGGYWPVLIVQLQERLAARGTTEHVDLLLFGPSWSVFGLIDYQGQTMLIPLQDEGKLFPMLDFSGERMYALDEIMPLIHEQARLVTEELERQNREFLTRYPTSDPNRPEPTDEPTPDLATPFPGPPSTLTPQGAP